MHAIVTKHIQKASPFIAAIINILFPARCAGCAESVGSHGALCVPCWQNIHFITDPLCHHCGLPFDYAIGERALCGHCMQHKPAYTQARALFRYDQHSRNQILSLKYHDKTGLVPIYGQWLVRIAESYKKQVDVIMPVPLHYSRLVWRRYNQAALLAHALADRTQITCLPDTLQRIRKTPTQSGLTRRQREDNVRGAFRIKAKNRDLIKGKSVLLVDDVMTTGATLDACARTLHDAGVIDVYVVTLARTVMGD